MAGNPEINNVDQVNKNNFELITSETVTSKDERYSVTISVYRTGVSERVVGSYVVWRDELLFKLTYSNNTVVCRGDCEDAVTAISNATYRKVPKSLLTEKIKELRQKYTRKSKMPIVDYVKAKYPDKFAEIERDPIGWILSRTSYIFGYEDLKVLVLLAVVSSRLEQSEGMSRINLMLVGKSGAGKTTTVMSVLRYLKGTSFFINATRITENALGYLNIKTYNGKIVFIGQIDKQNINYLRELMSDDEVSTISTGEAVKRGGVKGFTGLRKRIVGQPVVITTSVAEDVTIEREQLYNRFLKVYVKFDKVNKRGLVYKMYEKRKVKPKPDKVDRLVFLAWLLSRPRNAEIPPHILDRLEEFREELSKATPETPTRAIEVFMNLLIATAVMHGRTVVTDDDYNFVEKNFKNVVFVSGLGLTNRDIEVIELLGRGGDYPLRISDIAKELKWTLQYTSQIVKNLERKNVVEWFTPNEGKTPFWRLTELGRNILGIIGAERVDEKVEEELINYLKEKGEVDYDVLLGSFDITVVEDLKAKGVISVFEDPDTRKKKARLNEDLKVQKSEQIQSEQNVQR